MLHNAASKGNIDKVKILLSDERFTNQINAKNNVGDNIRWYITCD